RGRPAFAVEVRGDGAGADEGPVVGAHRLDVRRGADAAGQVRTGPDQGPGAAGDLAAVHPVDGAVAGAAGADRRSGDDVVVGGVHRVILGVARPGGAAAPRDVVDQLDLSRGRQAAVQVAGPFGQRVVAGGAVVRRVLAQPAPRGPDVGAARCGARAAGLLGAADPLLRAGGLGVR